MAKLWCEFPIGSYQRRNGIETLFSKGPFLEMTSGVDNLAVALICRPSGILVEIIYDELGVQQRLTPGQELSRIVAPFHVRKINRFLRTIQVSRSALDWELTVVLPHGFLPLMFSGSVGAHGIIIIGTKGPLDTAAAPVRLSRLAGKSTEAVMFAIDELRTRTKEKAKVEEKLQQQLFELNQALAVQAHVERGVNSALGYRPLRLLEIAAHDLRNPISSVMAATQYLIEDAGPRLDTHHVTLLQSIESSAGLMLQLLQDMLEIPAISPKRMSLHLRTTDIGLLVEHAVAASQPLGKSRKVSMEVRLRKPVLAVEADPVRISRALESLLRSAIRSCHAGSSLEVVVGADDSHVLVTLRHDGSGESNVLWDLFHHPETNLRSRNVSDERASLTAAYLKRVVEAHRGTVRFEAGRKQESVTLSLPVSPEGKSRERQKEGRKTRETSGEG